MALMKPVFREKIPPLLYSANVSDLHSLLNGPALFFLEGVRKPSLIVSTLLHGNEHTGFLALRNWLHPYSVGAKPLPRSLWIFIGNTEAAQSNLRFLPHQPDYNRIWRGRLGPEGEMARKVTQLVTRDPLFAAVDIHNNSGSNPYYACVSRWQRSHIQLAGLFGRTVVHATQPAESFAHAFSDFSPSVTLECGVSGEQQGIQRTIEYLEAVLHLSEFTPHGFSSVDIDGYHTAARVRVRPHVDFFFEELKQVSPVNKTLVLRSDLERLNFCPLPVGTLIGRYQGTDIPLEVLDENQYDPKLLNFENGRISTATEVTPAMFTIKERAIREDCLGYLMKGKQVPSP